MTEEPQRILAWEGCLNVRDLGGYPTSAGRETRWGRVVRADNLGLLTERGRQALVDYGIRSIVDLRKPEEIQAHPNPFAGAAANTSDLDGHVAYTNISLVDPAAKRSSDFTTLANDYKDILDLFKAEIAAVMISIAQAPEGPVLIHCVGGKDRTGIISALLLDLAGVSRETIGEDYALTAECLQPRDQEWLENGPGERAWREQELPKFTPRVEVMLEVLDHLDQRYGGVEPYLLAAGVSREDIQSLRDRLLA